MSVITYNNVKAALVKGSTWGTEADVTSGGIKLQASSIKVSASYADFNPRDFGFSGFKTNTARLALNAGVDISADFTYGGAGWLAIAAFFMGTESSPSEQTVGEADYLSNIDLAESIDDLFFSLMYSIETDRTIAMYSVKPYEMTLNILLNGAGSVNFKCFADRVVEGSANTVSEIAALTSYEYETAIFGSFSGTNHYFRIKDYSTGSSLSSTHNKSITGVTITIRRPLNPKYGLNGASSGYIQEPRQIGLIDGTIKVDYDRLDNATWDLLADWQTPGFRMAELFLDGTQIGAGVHRSFKFQMPYLKVNGDLPLGHDVQSNNGEFLPSITYNMHYTGTAASGMSSVYNYMRMVAISKTRSTKWTS